MLACSAAAQNITGFMWPVFFERAEMEKGQTNRLKTLVTGKSAEPQTNGWMLVSDPRIVHFLPSGATNVVATSVACFLNPDPRSRTISSTNALTIVAGTNQMRVEGIGYFGHLTNLFFIISNDVSTVIRQELAKSASTNAGLLGAATVAPTNSEIHITATRLHLDYERNVATYFGNVHVENPTTELDAEKLIIKRAPQGNLENILAETNVVIRQKLDAGQASGDRALYYMRDGQEALMLTGAPARWQQREREGDANWFTYYVNDRILRAEEKARVRFPLAGAAQGDWLLPGRRRANVPAPPLEQQLMEVHAEAITSWLATSNRPGHRVVAQTNVTIVGVFEQTLATAASAEYQEHLGTLELAGDAYWQQGQRIVRGERLFYDRTNQIFLAEGGAYLQVPANEMARPGQTNRIPQFIQTHSDRFDFRNGYLTFYDNVRSALVESNLVRGTLNSDVVRLKLGNQVEDITARRNVEAEEFRPIRGGMESRKLNCESLRVELNTNGWLRRVYADTNVIAQQTRREGAKTNLSSLRAESILADFFTHTNDVRELRAEQNVVITSDEGIATGQLAVYTATNQLVELTGHPTLETPRIKFDQADAILFDRATQKFSARNPSGQARAPTNTANLAPFPTGK